MSALPAGAAERTGIRPVEISSTPHGVAVATAAARRWARDGFATTPQNVQVWRDSTGITIAPRDAGIALLASSSTNGSIRVEVVPTTAQRRPTEARRIAATAQPHWQRVGSQCFTRVSDTWSWLDHCYQMLREQNDGDGNRDYYLLVHYATLDRNDPWVVNRGAIASSAASTSSPQSWVDWSPVGSTSGPCQYVNVSLSFPISGISYSLDRCETWTVNKGGAAGEFSVQWSGPDTRSSRGIAFEISVQVRQGSWPVWLLPAAVEGSPF